MSAVPGDDERLTLRPAMALATEATRAGSHLTLLADAPAMPALYAMFAAEIAAGRLSVEDMRDEAATTLALAGGEVFVALGAEGATWVGVKEAMAAGLAVIDVSGVRPGPDVPTLPDETGVILPRGDMRGLRQTLKLLAQDPNRLMGWREGARAAAEAFSLSPQDHVDRYAALLEEMLAELRSGAFVAPPPFVPHPDWQGLSFSPFPAGPL